MLTAGATSATTGAVSVALPEAGAPAGATPVPDLATALRQRPGTARLRVIGQGLPARDRDAVAGLPLQFMPPAPLPGLIRLSSTRRRRSHPATTSACASQPAGLPGARVELLDPSAGRRADAAAADAQGSFILAGAGTHGRPNAVCRARPRPRRRRTRAPAAAAAGG